MKNRSFIFLLLIVLSLPTAAISASKLVAERSARELISLRKLGHLLLLSAKDSLSRVMPVTETEKGTFQIRFEKPFSLVPDSLVEIVTRMVKDRQLSGSYTLSVFEQGSDRMVFGFTSEDILKGTAPCIGRAMPVGRYEIYVKYSSGELAAKYLNLPLYPSIFSALVIVGSAAGLGFYKHRQGRKRLVQVLPVNKTAELPVAIGGYVFHPSSQMLTCGANKSPLTPKELTLLSIFLRHPNEVIDRNLLLKLGWEDEGVITGRSLDMYVSKLRKKFADDPSITIRNVHGKGYSLNVASPTSLNTFIKSITGNFRKFTCRY